MNANEQTRPAALAISTSSYRAWAGLIGVVSFALLTAAGAAIKVPVPGTPVPITLQSLFVVLAGVTLGPWLGSASMAFYLLMGALGYGVFAGEVADVPQVFGATGGYLIGFLVAQPIIGCIARHSHRSWAGLTAAVLAGSAVIFLCGLSWLAFSSGASLAATLAMGLYPFLPGLALKTWLAISAGRVLHPVARSLFDQHGQSR